PIHPTVMTGPRVTADTYVHDGASPGDVDSAATASAARSAASRVASSGAAPESRRATSSAAPVSAAAWEASSGRWDEPTPSHTTAATPEEWAATANASSLRL